MKQLLIQAMLIIAFFTSSLQAQVTIGSNVQPNAGALLDLKQNTDGTSTKGLALPRVELSDISRLQIGTAPELSGEEREKHIGLLVYNTKEDLPRCLSSGIYSWNGEQWIALSGKIANSAEESEELKQQLADSLALVAIYNATNGDSWNNSANWLTDKEIYWWWGVSVEHKYTCINNHPRYTYTVSRLYLTSNNLQNTLPAEIKNLKNLEVLNIYQNQITGLPQEIGDLRNLKDLSISYNSLITLPEDIKRLISLEKLNAAQNDLTGPIPGWLGDLTNLTHLNLASNSLSGVIPSDLKNLKNLTYITLERNMQLSGPIPDWFTEFTNLEELYLHDNQFSGPIPANMNRLTELSKLFLQNNELTGPIPAEIGQLPKLEKLRLQQNNLLGPIPLSIGDLTGLTQLELDRNQLTGDIQHLERLTNLNYFNIGNNQLTGTIPNNLLPFSFNYCCPQYIEGSPGVINPTPWTNFASGCK